MKIGNWAFEGSIRYRIGSDNFYNLDTLKLFVFDYEVRLGRKYKNFEALWPHAWVNILGLMIGFGFIFTWNKDES